MIPDGLYYTQEHEWLKVEGDVGTVGVTDHAQEALGDLTFVELPAEGDEVTQGGETAALESHKAAADVYAPASGTVEKVNSALEDEPGTVNGDPYGAGWLYTVRLKDKGELDSLMDAKAYADLIGEKD